MNRIVDDSAGGEPLCSTSNQGSGNIDFVSLEDDARLAAALSREENGGIDQNIHCDSDSALAMILQRQFDMEYDCDLEKQEARINGQSKVGVSLDNFKRTPKSKPNSVGSNLCHYSEQCNSIEDDPFFKPQSGQTASKSAWDTFEQSELQQRSRAMGLRGFLIDEEGNVITKHDIPTSSKRNMCRLMELKTDIRTGDAGTFKDDFRINNHVYNHLKVHSKKSSRRASQRAFDKKERENDAILQDIQSAKMSDATRAIMDGLLIAYKIEKLNGVIGHGKESTVLHATGRNHEDTPGQEVAIKIFKSDRKSVV